MNKNKENYKKALDQIYPSEELKENTFKKASLKPKVRKPVFMKYLAACAVFALCFSLGALYLNYKNPPTENKEMPNQEKTIAQIENDLPRFESMEELKNAIEENQMEYYNISDSLDVMTDNASSETTKEESTTYSKTNIQVEGVDEADIVKTDGKNIYYITEQKIYIIDAKKLKILSTIEYNVTNNSFYPSELYINENKLIVLGTGYEYNTQQENYEENEVLYDYAYRMTENYTKAIIYNIANKEKPSKEREITIDGAYDTSRMINDNIYLISSKRVYAYYIDEMADEQILPKVKDSANEEKIIDCTEIAYFQETDNNSFMIVAGFNINDKKEVQTETFFGASDTVYSSKENLYITQTQYKYLLISEKVTTTIYKFNLENSQITLQAKAEVSGSLNDQFSMDEYEGNLRIATTNGYDSSAENQIYILNENLEQIGKIENLAKGETIYSVRFIGKMGYIVTFEQIDPLFVIDLSNPKNPKVKGELKIPGYSSYLHPYDETHIIGIGYNTKSNGYGGIVNDNMKMSMFDISDIQNPKELFSIDIGKGHTYSEITSNHKALFYSKDKNLIGFPVEYSDDNASNYTYSSKFEIFKIDLEKGFEKYGSLKEKDEEIYYNKIKRAIYIEQTLYVLSTDKITTYNLETLEQEQQLELD